MSDDVGGEEPTRPFPARMIDWAGHRSGGVRRLFDEDSGRPGGSVFHTGLLQRLNEWVAAIASGDRTVPRVLLLIGGPGNGKTEAIESTVLWLDRALNADEKIIAELQRHFLPPEGKPVPRLVYVDAGTIAGLDRKLGLSIVQDATAVSGYEGKQAPQLLLEELSSVLGGSEDEAYLCCVNRGILDDALIASIDSDRNDARRLLEIVTNAVSLTPNAPQCWPLKGFPEVAVWPMDAESLFTSPGEGKLPPARELFMRATEESKWPVAGTCVAGPSCPFCASRGLLAQEKERDSLIQMLRWYEVGSGKRWSFRDLFSLASYLLSGHNSHSRDASIDPCRWAARLLELDGLARRKAKPLRENSTAIFQLVSAQYQHALFHRWDKDSGPSLQRHVKELGLDDDNTAMGLLWFLNSRKSGYLPATIAPLLEGIVDILDPALASPDTSIKLSTRTTIMLRDIDVRFSRSVTEGLDYVRKTQGLSKMEVELLERLAGLDAHLSIAGVRRKRPAAASNVQRMVRDFACRLVRRSIGAKTSTTLDATILRDFRKVVEDDAGDDLFDVAREVERLLNTNQDFEISLTTTFGQPLPPASRRATLVVQARPVQPLHTESVGRPQSPIAFLKVGKGKSSQAVALTYDLFKAVKELERGMSVASLPHTVLALLDTTRARLSGPIVRDPEILERARIRIGTGGLLVEKRRAGFSARKEPTPR
ncbi:hypothetical protein [Agrobacterium tumefaciens]|uniref:hypothetical protein n=1 Tax=Agrobacterium tumefaciens TaxID=358 RepID=UPI003BA14BB9